MSLLPIVEWLNELRIGVLLRQSRIASPLLESVHLMGFTLLVGTIVAVDLRILGMVLRRESVMRVVKGLAPYIWSGMAVMGISGLLLLARDAMKVYENHLFPVKMSLLAVTLIYHFTIYRKATASEEAATLSKTRWTAVTSLVLWLGVGLAGQAVVTL